MPGAGTYYEKKYFDEFNPRKDFIAIMTCSHAGNTCPLVDEAILRESVPYEDPKIADNTLLEEAKYDERYGQIAIEMFYFFSQV